MATRKTNQLDINLGNVKDEGTRQALSSIVRFVNEMTQGITSNKTIKSSGFSNSNGSASIEKDGVISGRMLELDRGGKFKVKVVSGTLLASASSSIDLPDGHFILGVFGWSQSNTTSTWRPMPIGSASANVVHISTSSGDVDSVTFTSSDTDSSNDFHAVIFYTRGR